MEAYRGENARKGFPEDGDAWAEKCHKIYLVHILVFGLQFSSALIHYFSVSALSSKQEQSGESEWCK